MIDSWEKISLDKKSLQIQAKSCDFILNPDFTCSIFLIKGLASDLLWFDIAYGITVKCNLCELKQCFPLSPLLRQEIILANLNRELCNVNYKI